MNAAQVRAKARMAMKRREEEIEQEEMEGGELNLVPYLDIVTNVMLFLLATVTSGLILGNINSALPEYSQSDSPSGAKSNDEPEEPPLNMAVFLTPEKLTFTSLAGLEGTPEEPLLEMPVPKGAKDNTVEEIARVQNEYKKLTEAAQGIILKRWKGKFPMGVDEKDEPVCKDGQGQKLEKSACRPRSATEVMLVVQSDVPYHTIISTMDALRQNADPAMTYPDNLLFPDVIFGTGIK